MDRNQGWRDATSGLSPQDNQPTEYYRGYYAAEDFKVFADIVRPCKQMLEINADLESQKRRG